VCPKAENQRNQEVLLYENPKTAIHQLLQLQGYTPAGPNSSDEKDLLGSKSVRRPNHLV
jgi:hypothetical protein